MKRLEGARANTARRSATRRQLGVAVGVLAAVGLLGTATAKPRPAKPAPSAGARQTYAAKLREGRKLTSQKQYVQAIASFEAALAANPDEPTALAELGWAAYLANDLPKAETFTRKAIARNAAPSVKGAALYNLGLILEAKQDPDKAIAAYVDSLEVRPNAIVRARLLKLSPSRRARSIHSHPIRPMDRPHLRLPSAARSPQRSTAGRARAARRTLSRRSSPRRFWAPC